ncbi:MAG: hypothetical protein LQ337_007118 [Flavoplaca oasis]|nr:MAG: hypothetical protein LQ337_007118 [Flavoplaca oasis]
MLGQARSVQLTDDAVPSTIIDDETVDPDVDAEIDEKTDEEMMELLPEIVPAKD